MTDYILIYCTCHNNAIANNIANTLVSLGLAACVNIIPNITSVFKWENAILSEQEHLLIIKTVQKNFSALEIEISKHHPYTVPEIIAVTVSLGNKNYLDWIHASTIEPMN